MAVTWRPVIKYIYCYNKTKYCKYLFTSTIYFSNFVLLEGWMYLYMILDTLCSECAFVTFLNYLDVIPPVLEIRTIAPRNSDFGEPFFS